MPALTVPAELPVMVEAEAAALLRELLGPCRVWTFALTDDRKRGVESDLPPAFRVGKRYWYVEQDVRDFAARFQFDHPEASPHQPIQVQKAGDVLRGRTATKVRADLDMKNTAPATLH